MVAPVTGMFRMVPTSPPPATPSSISIHATSHLQPHDHPTRQNTMADSTSPADTLRVISLNCWGLKALSKHRHARLVEIGHRLASASPPWDIVALQEVWTQEDFQAIAALVAATLPHARFFWSGFFGSGLAILSAHPIEESHVATYPLNGRPAAVWRGDWYVGKGIATARVRLTDRRTGAAVDAGPAGVVEVFCTHLHAPYEREPHDSYLAHRTAQAWVVARALRHACERGHAVVACGDFNMLPGSLAHGIITAHAPVRDVWREVWPDSALGAAEDSVERARGREVPSARECLEVHGATCDSTFNTWRWSKAMQKDLDKGRDRSVDPEAEDLRAKRLDYVFFASPSADRQGEWKVQDVKVGMTERHPTLKCSLSDHFSIEAVLKREPRQEGAEERKVIRHLPLSTYDEILDMNATYMLRERKQRRWREWHFLASLPISIACLIGVWWSPHNYVAFILMLVSTLNLTAGVLDGLMGFLFVKSELRALKEFEYDVRTVRTQAARIASNGHAKGDAYAEV